MFCSKCGSQVAENAAFCPSCGQPTSVQSSPPRGIPLAPAGFVPQQPAGAPSAAFPPQQQPVAYAPAAVSPLGYAGFWLRFVAWLIDYILVGIAFSFISFPIMAATSMRSWIGNPPQSPQEMLAFFAAFSKLIVLSVIFNWLYYALLESSAWQATIGKKTLGLEVTDMAGHRISFGRATGRFFGKFISALILMIGYIMAGFTAQKQALHDMMAGCLVMRKI
jgi:uncharacterized RDD family membrane protein YckC